MNASTATPTLVEPGHRAHPLLREDERQRCEVWTRVMGYHRPVASFNTGKLGEFKERLCFQEQRVSAAAQGR